MLNPIFKKLAYKEEYSVFIDSSISDLVLNFQSENSENPDWIFFSFLNLEDLTLKSKVLSKLLSKSDPIIWI